MSARNMIKSNCCFAEASTQEIDGIDAFCFESVLEPIPVLHCDQAKRDGKEKLISRKCGRRLFFFIEKQETSCKLGERPDREKAVTSATGFNSSLFPAYKCLCNLIFVPNREKKIGWKFGNQEENSSGDSIRAEVSYMIVLKDSSRTDYMALFFSLLIASRTFVFVFLCRGRMWANWNWKGALGTTSTKTHNLGSQAQLWMTPVRALMAAVGASALADVECPWHSSIEAGQEPVERFLFLTSPSKDRACQCKGFSSGAMSHGTAGNHRKYVWKRAQDAIWAYIPAWGRISSTQTSS